MSNKEGTKLLNLSAKGLAMISWDNYECDFKFKIGTKEYFCPSFVAEFLSPRISNLRKNDCTIQEFQLETVDSEKCFECFLSLGFGSSVCLNGEDYLIFENLSFELGATEFYEQIFKEFSGDINPENVCDRLKKLEQLNCFCDDEIAFAASHFKNIDSTSIEKLSVSLLFQILKHDSLRIENEDWLFDIVLSLISKDQDYCSRLELIGYEYLSKSSIESFIDLISKSFEFLTYSIWQNLRSRLISGRNVSTSSRVTQKTFKFGEDSRFDGIISFLTPINGRNVCDCDIVSVKSSSVSGCYQAKNVADLRNSIMACTNNEPNSWISYDFQKMEVNVSHYSLHSRIEYDADHPTNWTLEGSLDGENWIEIDVENECLSLIGLNRSATFATSRSEFVRFVRIRQHGKNSSGNHWLVLLKFELFGVLRHF
jgi:hypothetical protein